MDEFHKSVVEKTGVCHRSSSGYARFVFFLCFECNSFNCTFYF